MFPAASGSHRTLIFSSSITTFQPNVYLFAFFRLKPGTVRKKALLQNDAGWQDV